MSATVSCAPSPRPSPARGEGELVGIYISAGDKADVL